jgi:hypothetical protein
MWHEKEWQDATPYRKAPSSLDKEFTRQWGMTVDVPLKGNPKGLQRLDPVNPEHVTFVHSLTVPSPVIKRTAAIYAALCRQVLGEWKLNT